MQPKSYPIIDVSKKTLMIMKYIGNSAHPVTTKELESKFDIKYPTLLTHLYTLVQEKCIEEVDGGYIVAFELASLWANRKRLNGFTQKRLDKEYETLNVED